MRLFSAQEGNPIPRRDRRRLETHHRCASLRRTGRLAGLPVLAALGLSSCAIATPHTNISRWPVAAKAMYYRDPAPYRLGVLLLADRRPAVERNGQRPTGIFLVLWNRRVGDYYTNDQVFGGQVAHRLTEQLMEYLAASHAFAEAIFIVPPQELRLDDPLSVSRAGREQVVDILLHGELRHFFGSQYQHVSIYMLPLYFVGMFGWQNAKALPWGRTSIAFTLYDGRTGELLWRRLLEADHTLPRDTDAMTEAALESFVEVTGRLAADLRQVSLEVEPSGR
jgi:hypothetical protein